MTLLRDVLEIGAFPSTETVRRAFEILEDQLLGGPPPSTEQQDDIDRTLQEIRDSISTNAGCKRFRDLLYDMGLFGSARSRRVKAVAAQLGIDIELITDCLRKSRDELEAEEDAEIDLELEAPEAPPLEEPEECPIDLKTWLCLPAERIPKDDDACEPAPLPGAEDLRTFDPFPTVPDVDDAAELCRFAENKLAIAKSTGEILSTSTLSGFLRMFHALAFRPNPPPGILYKRCTETAMETLTDYWGSGLVDPPTPAETATIEQINEQLQDYDDERHADLTGDSLTIAAMLDDAEELGLTPTEATPWLALINSVRDDALALGEEHQTQLMEEYALKIEHLLQTTNPDPDRPAPPGIYRFILPLEKRREEYLQSSTAYANYLTNQKARGIPISPHDQGFLDVLEATKDVR